MRSKIWTLQQEHLSAASDLSLLVPGDRCGCATETLTAAVAYLDKVQLRIAIPLCDDIYFAKFAAEIAGDDR